MSKGSEQREKDEGGKQSQMGECTIAYACVFKLGRIERGQMRLHM